MLTVNGCERTLLFDGARDAPQKDDETTMTTINTEITTRPVTVAIDTACKHAGEVLIWGVAEGDDDHAAGATIEDAVQWLAGGDTVRQSHRRDAMALDVVTIQWPADERLPDGQNERAIALALAAV